MKPTIRFMLAALLFTLPPAAQADAAALAHNCAGCHGQAGVSRGELIPNIAGQRETYLRRVLAEYKQGRRPSLFMGRLAKGYADQELETVAAHYARLQWTPAEQATDTQAVEKGRELAQQRCAACHGSGGASGSETAPLIAGQWVGYLKVELERFLDPKAMAPDSAMRGVLAGLDGADIEALAQYYASQR